MLFRSYFNDSEEPDAAHKAMSLQKYAKKLLIIIGTEEIITKMVVNNKRTNRYTCLTAMLREEIKPHE